jgi:hypothetical protein
MFFYRPGILFCIYNALHFCGITYFGNGLYTATFSRHDEAVHLLFLSGLFASSFVLATSDCCSSFD